MALEEIDITASGSISGTTMSADTVSVGGNLITLTNAYFPLLTATTISGGTILSGGTDLSNIFQTPGQDYIKNIITVGKAGHVDFTSIKSAIDSITGNSQTNQFLVDVGPGLYIEDTITLKPFVRLKGSGMFQTAININNPNKTIIVGANISAIENLIIGGATGTTGVGIYYNGTGATVGAMLVNDCFFASNHTQVIISAQTPNTTFLSNGCIFGGPGFSFDKGFIITNTLGNTAQVSLDNIRLRATTAPYVSTFLELYGNNNIVTFKDADLLANSAITTFNVYDGSDLHVSGTLIKGFENGIQTTNSGLAPQIEASGVIFEGVTNNLNIQHTGTTGFFIGSSEYLKTFIPDSAPFFITNKDSHIITVAKKGGDFTSVFDALSSITGSSMNNRYKVLIGPGIFVEPELFVPSFVSVVGSVIAITIIRPDGAHHVFNLENPNVELSFFEIQSANTGYAGIFINDTGNFAQAHKLIFVDCDTNVLVQSITRDTYFYGEYIDYNGAYTYGTKVISSGGFIAFSNLENYYNLPSVSGSTGTYAQGPNAVVHVLASGNDTTSNANPPLGGTAFYLEDGATMVISSTNITGWDYGIRLANIGAASILRATSVAQDNNNIIYDLFIEHPGSIGNYQGVADMDKLNINPAATNFNISIQHTDEGSLNISNRLNVRYNNGTLTDMSTLIGEASTMGVMEGGELTVGTGFTVNIASGFGYFEQFPDNDVDQKINWPSTAITLSANADEYVYFNSNGILTSNSSEPDTRYSILLGRAVTNSTGIELIDASPSDAEHTSNLFSNNFKNAIGPVYASGSIVTENATPLHIDVTTGKYYFGENVFNPLGGTGITFTSIYGQGSGVVTGQTAVSNTQYDSGGTLTSLSGSYYTKHCIYLVGEGSNEKYYLIYGQNQYSTLLSTQQGDLPSIPTYFRGSVTLIAGIIVQQGTSNIIQIIDERPRIGFRVNGVNASADHLSLLNLNTGDAGHHQFLMLDGSKPMAGTLNMNGNPIISGLTYNGVTIESHSSRHLPNGADPLSSATAVSLSNANTTGIANAFSRADHTHAHASQSGGTTHSLVDSTNAGFMSSADKIYFDTISGQFSTKANLSGATFTGQVNAVALSATTLSGGTIYSGSTNLYQIFAPLGGEVVAISNGTNTYTGGTAVNPTVNVSALTINTLVATGNTQLSATTITLLTANTISNGTQSLGGYNVNLTGSSRILTAQTDAIIIQGWNANISAIRNDVSTGTGVMWDGPDILSLHTAGPQRILINALGQISNGSQNALSTGAILNAVYFSGQTKVDSLTGGTISGDTIYGNVISGNTISGGTLNLTNTFKFTNGPVANYVLTTDSGGTGTWQVNPSAGLKAYFFTTFSADTSGSTYQQLTPNTVTGQTITTIGVTDTQVLATFITYSGQPSTTFLPAGLFSVYITAVKTFGSKAVQLYSEVYSYSSGGVETLLVTTNTTPILGASNSVFLMQGVLTAATALASTDRVEVKVRARVTGGGPPIVNTLLTVGDATLSRLEIPFDIPDVLGFVPYTGATSDVLLGTKNLSAQNISGGTIYSGSTNLYQIFAPLGGEVVAISNGTNTYTGGTAINPTVNVSALTINTLNTSGNTQLGATTASSLSAGTFYSGSTDLYQIILSASTALWSASTGLKSIIANNGSGNLASGTFSIAGGTKNTASASGSSIVGGSGNTASGTDSFVGGGRSNSAITNFTAIVGGQLNLASGYNSFIGAGILNKALGGASFVGGGYSNLATVDYSVIVGGRNNIASGTISFVGGGATNEAFGNYSFIGGGQLNTANTNHATIVGGYKNIASGYKSFVGGGYKNSATSVYTAVVGGDSNIASGTRAFVGGGRYNNASGYISTVAGGVLNIASGDYSVAVGGSANKSLSYRTFVGGGYGNSATTNYAAVVGGQLNRASGSRSFIGGGYLNKSTNLYSIVVGGKNNYASGVTAFIGGGTSSVASGLGSFIGSGGFHRASGLGSFVGGGGYNSATTIYSTVVGGQLNIASGNRSFIGGGRQNSATTNYATIVGGSQNRVTGEYSFIGGGRSNTASGYKSAVVGGQSNSASEYESFVGAGGSNVASGIQSFVGAGFSNIASGDYSSAVGGGGNRASGYFSFIGGGRANSATTNYAVTVGGQFNRASGAHSAILNGSGNTVTGLRSAVIGGQSISGTSNDTVYMPNARLAETTGTVVFSAGTDLYNIFPRKGAGLVFVNSASDFPAPVGGIIYLSANTQYLINGIIKVGNPFRIDSGRSDIIGKDRYLDQIIYSGTGTMFNFTQPSLFSNIGIQASAATNVFSGVMNTTGLFRVSDSKFENCNNIGSVSGGQFTTINSNRFLNITGNGFTFTSTKHLRYELNDHEFVFSGTIFYANAGTYETIDIIGNYIDLPLSGIGINIHTGVTFINSLGGGLMVNNLVVGTVTGATPLSGIQHYDSVWEIKSNASIPDSQASGEIYLNGNVTATVLAVNVWSKASGTTSSGTLEQLIMSGNNRLQYIGTRTKEAIVSASFSVSSPVNNQTIQASIYKNGVQDASSICEMRTITGGQSVAGATHAVVTLNQNDYFELYIRNITASNSATVEFLNFTIHE